MTVTLTKRADINLKAFRRVAWAGEDVILSDIAIAEIERSHRRNKSPAPI